VVDGVHQLGRSLARPLAVDRLCGGAPLRRRSSGRLLRVLLGRSRGGREVLLRLLLGRRSVSLLRRRRGISLGRRGSVALLLLLLRRRRARRSCIAISGRRDAAEVGGSYEGSTAGTFLIETKRRREGGARQTMALLAWWVQDVGQRLNVKMLERWTGTKAAPSPERGTRPNINLSPHFQFRGTSLTGATAMLHVGATGRGSAVGSIAAHLDWGGKRGTVFLDRALRESRLNSGFALELVAGNSAGQKCIRS
jgi:hypothetical protein